MIRKSLGLIVVLFIFPIFSVKAQSPVISYLIPDIGTNQMNTYVEIVAPYYGLGSFGPDSLYANNSGDFVRVMCSNPLDTSKLTIGPVVVSWNGRLISTQIFVSSCHIPNSSDWRALDSGFRVPIKVIVNGQSSNSDTFFIVRPTPAIVTSLSGVLGAGGIWGVRSKRGALLFDSLILSGSTYTISTADCDPAQIGNQGFLPANILSKGPIHLVSGAFISVNASGRTAGPGGGGGSMGDGPTTDSGGSGYTGGSPGESEPGKCPATGGLGTGGVGNVNAGGIGLNGIPTEPSDVPQCEYFGGSGNPFISSSGGILDHNKHEGDGNGGGFATAGEDGRGERGNTPERGGIVNGNPMLIPLMGGSGGGGSNEFCTCDGSSPGAAGGGGGGALLLYGSKLSLSGTTISSNGASGVTGGSGCVGHGSVGGCGSGGGVILESKLASSFPSITVAGGTSIHTHSLAGNGGQGRVRVDGPQTVSPSVTPSAASTYRGLSTDTTAFSSGTVTLTGTGSGDSIRVYSKTGNGPWLLSASISNYSSNSWSHVFSFDPTKTTYLVAVQSVPYTITDTATRQPSWVMSQSAANRLSTISEIASSRPNTIGNAFKPISACIDTSVFEYLSIGCSQFRIDSLKIQFDTGGVFFVDPKTQLPHVIDYYGSDSIRIIFHPNGRGGVFGARAHLWGTLLSAGTQYDTVLDLFAISSSSGSLYPSVHPIPFSLTPDCEDGDAYTLLNIGCQLFEVDSVKIENDTSGVFHLDPKQKYPTTISYSKADSIHIIFHPNHRIGGFGARLHIFGKLSAQGSGFDTIISLVAGSVPSVPILYPTANQLQWRSVIECSSGDTVITFTNQGCDTVSVDSLHSLGGRSLFLQSIALPRKVAPNASIQVRVHYTPDALNPDSLTASLFYSSTGFIDSIHVPINAQASPALPSLSSSASRINFGAGYSCDELDTTIYLKNTGCDSLLLTSLLIGAGSYSISPQPALPLVIPKGDSIALHIKYHPSSIVDTQSIFYTSKNGGKTANGKIFLFGTVRTTFLAYSPDSLNMGAVALCSFSDSIVSLHNPGCDTIQITSANIIPAGDVKFSGVTLPITLPPHSDTIIAVHFSSNVQEDITTILILDSYIKGIQQPRIEIPVHASASAPTQSLGLSDTSVRLPSLSFCKSDTLIVRLYNRGCDTLDVAIGDLIGDPDFRALSGSESVRLGPGDSSSVSIVVAPQNKGNRNSAIPIKYWNSQNGNKADTSVSLQAFVTGGSRILSSDIQSVDFGKLTLCSSADTTIILRNEGCDTLSIDSASFDEHFFKMIPSGNFPITIAPDSLYTCHTLALVDTTGHVSKNQANLTFYSNSNPPLSPIPLSFSIDYPAAIGFELVPMTESAKPDTPIYYDVRTIRNLGVYGVNDVSFILRTNQDLLSYTHAESPDLVNEYMTATNGVASYHFAVTGNPIHQEADGRIARLWFIPYVADSTHSSIELDSLRLDPSDPDFERCTAQAFASTDTNFDIINTCGQSSLRKVLESLPITISTYMEGSHLILRVEAEKNFVGHLQVFNVLGTVLSNESLHVTAGVCNYAISANLPEGLFFARIEDSDGHVARAKFINTHP